MGGDITVKSKPGLGTSMIAVFPSETCPEVSLMRSVESVGSSDNIRRDNLIGKKGLIIDDIPESLYILGQIMDKCGAMTVGKIRAQDALEEFKRAPDFDFIITDLRMPGMSGQALIMEIRRLEKEMGRPNKVPIMVLSGEAAQEERVACLGQYGADEYLLKPIKMCEFSKAVDNMLKAAKLKARHSRRILVVEDDMISRRLVMTLMKKNGDEPVGCCSVAEAKRELNENYEKYRVIFLDSQLQDGIGTDVLAECARLATERGKTVPVVSMSGNSAQDQRELYTGYSIHAFLQKPVSKAQLLDILRSIR